MRKKNDSTCRAYLKPVCLLIIVSLCGCVGTLFAAAVIGPVVAFIGGGILLQLYTHFDTIDTSTSVAYKSSCL